MLLRIIGEDNRFESFGWREQNPFDTGVTDPRTSMANKALHASGRQRRIRSQL